MATVQLEALLFQLPPRITRFDPEAAPVPQVYPKAGGPGKGDRRVHAD
jgi:hypothetical protein